MSVPSKIVAALRRQLRRRLKIDIINSSNTTTLRHLLEEFLNLYRIDTVLDVGANEGQFAIQLRDIGYSGDIHSFEPVGATFARLQRHAMGDSRWHCHNLALGRSTGTLSMNISEYSSFNSALSANAFGTERFHELKVVAREEVPLSTVDDFVSKTLGSRTARIFLKMDTQGFDLEVFEGARASLGQIHGLLSELSLMPIYEGMKRYPESLTRFERNGFAVSGFFPVNHNRDLSLIEVDCLMVKPQSLQATGAPVDRARFSRR